MSRRNYWMIIIFMTFLAIRCDKKEPAAPSESVAISQLTLDKTDATVEDIIKLECIANSSGALHYKWSLALSNTVYELGIVDRENKTDTFDFGQWISWKPPMPGGWEIEVIAYLSSADHPSSGNGSWRVFFEYLPGGVKRHCFNDADKGKLWDEKSITVSIHDGQ